MFKSNILVKNKENVTGFAKTVPNRTRIEIPFIAWHES